MSAFAWHDAAGAVGVAAIAGSYLLLQLGRLDPRSPAYSGANALGAALVLLSLVYRFNLAAFLVEAFWLGASLFGLARSVRRRREPPQRPA